MNKTRLEAFSDGVIAIIITIMVLELKAPHSYQWAEVKNLLEDLTGYAISFVMVAIYWGNHHHLLHTVQKVNSKIIWANMHLLFWLSLVPFATVWLEQNNFDEVTVIIYSALLMLCGAAYTILQMNIEANNVFTDKMKLALKWQGRKGILSVVFYSMAIAAAFFQPVVSVGFIVVVAIMWLIPDRNIEKAMED